ncbi:Zinc/iron permease [Dunaliella salina]|nr:Zinc/iron permease [Dunaliella salina]KAF5840682.1 Zinc/iron permease [Dunaliella salina]|eukprot:KAF5840681.1 Zinc/iron permease [Dunaliella salina]
MTNPIARWLRAASAGIVLSLGFVHILPKGIKEFGNLAGRVPLDPAYNPAGAAVIFGILMMMAVESTVHSINHGEEDTAEYIQHSEEPSDKNLEAKAKQNAADVEGQTQMQRSIEHPHDHKHGSVCMHGSHGHVSSATAAYGTLNQKTLAHMFELGCVVHSVIIGIALGIKDSNFPLARNVVIILCFHQLLEGIGLGAMVAIANFPKVKGVLLILFYSLTAPVGVAIGIGIATSYDKQSIARNATEGTLNSVSAGILIYMGLVQMVAVDFSPESLALLRHWWAKAGMFVSFFIACGCMTMLPVFKNVNND